MNLMLKKALAQQTSTVSKLHDTETEQLWQSKSQDKDSTHEEVSLRRAVDRPAVKRGKVVWMQESNVSRAIIPTPRQTVSHFSGFSALRQRQHRSPTAMLPAVLRLLVSSLLRAARSSLLLPSLNQLGPEKKRKQ
jgi:hypothetical protein